MTTATPDSFDLLEATVADVHAAMEAGEVTAEALVDRYLDRIDRYDDELNAVLTLNSDARERARDLDRQYEADGPVGPLHGVPTLVKDNHDTVDMPTTAGSVALADSRPPRDAAVVERLRDAGAVILGKTNLQELSFGVDTISSLGGETRNAYSRSHRPSGSSGGTAVAVAANLATLGTGSDTCSSVRSPPAFNACVGVRPTRGLVSRTGIVPLSLTQDTAGPITRTVGDAARMLEAMAGYDPADPVTARGADAVPDGGYVAHLDPDGLADARIGVARQFFGPREDPDDGVGTRTADAAAVTAVVDDAIATFESAGATVVDPVEVVDLGKLESARVLTYEWARDLARYLAEIGDATPHDSLADVVETGSIVDPIADRIEESGALDVDPAAVGGDPDYLRRLRRREEVREETLATMVENDLDALLYPPSRVPPVEIPAHQPFEELNCELSAHTGLPSIVVPAGTTDEGLPVGVELLGRAFAEPRLFELASGFERSADPRSPPAGLGPLE
ncbi:amidase [Halobaculum sp. WSA2]|uniref:Amidase n=1 Tax=Halobaculum saliterrae TaxID=2073113 RepID=A0A6B0SZX0_9EURY|nr:amidase family protein [Halobaculum saliterrae]MXR42133.1 amidase [Halobaculum saliterrae]